MKFLLISLALISSASAQFTAVGQQSILDIHNDMRSRVAMKSNPGAADMLKLEYDAGLEDSAQEHAERCPEINESGSSGIGQNIYWGKYTTPSENLDFHGVNAALKWRSELTLGFDSMRFSEDTVSEGVGEVAQMMWAKSGSLGCGVKDCGPSQVYTTNRVVVVCHYEAKGKIIGENIYTEGETGSQCPSGTTHEVSTGLCVKD